jgi:hypothetical protein
VCGADLKFMQHLLDFIQEHTFEDQLYFVVEGRSGELELFWKRGEVESHWQLRPRGSEGPWELIRRSELIAELESRHVDMVGVKRELNAVLAVQIAFADMLLRDANQQFGNELVERFVRGHQGFLTELQAAIEQLTGGTRPSMSIVPGGGEQTEVRAGHLSVVRK